MKINPIALVFWLQCGMIGFLIGGTAHATLVGLSIGLGISLLNDVLFCGN